MRDSNNFINFDIKQNGEISISTIMLKRGTFTFDFNEEADGTKRIFDLLDILT